tara:strand:+ start:82 stop:648 length:567 start_codon:yes stop_codon:yes gene_type:complete
MLTLASISKSQASLSPAQSCKKTTVAMLHLTLFLLGLTAVVGFPVTEVTMSNATFAALQNGPPNPTKDALASETVLPGLRHYFESKNVLEVSPTDVGTLHATLPSEVVDSSCGHKVTAESPTITGNLLNSSYFKWGLTNISWHGATVFAEASVASTMEVASDIQVKLGKSYKVVGLILFLVSTPLLLV